MMQRSWLIVLSLGMTCSGARLAAGQEPKPLPVNDAVESINAGSQPAAATIERIMDQAVRNIAVRYNLNEVQKEETDKLMKREVHRFLREHENEVWPAIRDLLAAQLGMNPPKRREDVMRIGKSAQPLVKLAKEAILEANKEWRLILTPEQRRMHDYDLAEMEKTFEQIDQNFDAWAEGHPPQGGIFPQPRVTDRQPPRPKRPEEGKLPDDPEIEIFDPNNIFETLVEEFIKEYQLEEGQVTAARSILEEFKVKANDFRDSNKEDFAKIERQQQKAYAARDIKAIKEAAAAHKKLLEPIFQLCAEMEDRLKLLLTTAQIQRHAERTAEPNGGRYVKKAKKAEKKSAPASGSAESESKPASDDG